MDGLVALQAANDGFEQRLRVVQARDWTLPTPCAAWDVRALANHVVGGNRRYLMLLHGASAEEVNRTRAHDHIGDDPVRSFMATAGELTSAFLEEGADSRIGHHPIGDRTGAQLLAMRVVDVTVHTWDLAHALKVDDSLDPAVVEFSLAHIEVITTGRDHGSFAMPTAKPSAGAPPQVRLVQLAGRSLADTPATPVAELQMKLTRKRRS